MVRVLCIDNSATIRRFVTKAIRQFKFKNIHEAENGLKGINFLSENEVDLIILDINMSVMNGIEFFKKRIENPGLFLLLKQIIRI